jgi:hypothetical protein
MSEQIVPDSEHRGLVARLPQMPRDLALLAVPQGDCSPRDKRSS